MLSLMPRATAFAREVVSVPFVQLDAVILDRVVKRHARIGVLTTTPHAKPYIEEGLNVRAEKIRKKIELVFGGNPGALTLFNAGEFDKHDAIVLGNIREPESLGVDCVFLGQVPFGMMEDTIRNIRLARKASSSTCPGNRSSSRTSCLNFSGRRCVAT